jgi:hypothetical protein
VSRLRKRLSAAGDAAMLATEPNGYRIAADAETLDLFDFRLLVSEARTAAREGRNARATERYRTALGLWRGPTLAGIDSIPVNLRGYAAGTTPLRPIDALAALLRSLGTPPEQIPTEEDQAAALYRTQAYDVPRLRRDVLMSRTALATPDRPERKRGTVEYGFTRCKVYGQRPS